MTDARTIATEHFKTLMKSPVDAPRLPLRELVRLTPTALAKLRKYGGSPEFRCPCVLTVALPRYEDWLKRVSRPRKLTAGIPTIPGYGDIAGPEWTTENYVAWFDRANNLKEIRA